MAVDFFTQQLVARKARLILFQQIANQRLHYPYRVATALGEFYDVFAPALSQENKEEIRRAAKYIAERIEKLPDFRQRKEHVVKCWEEMQRILETSV